MQTNESEPRLRSKRLQNWKGDIVYRAAAVEVIRSVNQLQEIVCDAEHYPSPVRAKGSHHSTTRCVVAEGGTVVDMSHFNKIVSIDREALTITAQAGVILIDAARELEKYGLQFFTCLEIGNLTLGSAATGSTKDASFVVGDVREPGQFCSYCVGMRTVQPDGTLLNVTADSDPTLLAAMRTGYGMLGIAYEVTFCVKPIAALAVEHESFHLDEFAARLPEFVARNKSMMLYMFPFLDQIIVEFKYVSNKPVRPRSPMWAARNFLWRVLWPFIANLLYFLPSRFLRNLISELVGRITVWAFVNLFRTDNSSPVDQIMRYPEKGGFSSATFSIWAVPLSEFPTTIRSYFAFCKEYDRVHGYRSDIMDLGYLVERDTSSHFSYSRDWTAMSIDPVATGRGGWKRFLVAYNEFCDKSGGKPLLNQTGKLTPTQVKKAFGDQVGSFKKLRSKIDPSERFLNDFFRNLFSEVM